MNRQGDIFIANTLGFGVERVRNGMAERILGIRENASKRPNLYSDLQVTDDGELWVLDSGAAEVLCADESGSIKKVIPGPPLVGGGEFMYMSSLDVHDGKILVAAQSVRAHAALSFSGVGPSGLYVYENEKWRLLVTAPEVTGDDSTTFRDAVYSGDGAIAALVGSRFLIIRDGRVTFSVDVQAHHGGGILERPDGWIVGAYTQLLKIHPDGKTNRVGFSSQIANIGDVQKISEDKILVTDTDRQTVYVHNFINGKVVEQIGNASAAMKVVSLAMKEDQLLMLDNATPRVIEGFLENGLKWVIAGTGRHGPDTAGLDHRFSLHFPSGMAIGPRGEIYVSESNYRIVRIFGGRVEIFAGGINPGKPSEGQRREDAQFGALRGLSVDSLGRVFVVDQGNHSVWMIGTDDRVSRVMGTGHAGLSKEGEPAISQPLNTPSGVLARRDGTILVSDTYNNLVLEIGLDRKIRYFAGQPLERKYQGLGAYSGDSGSARKAELNTPRGVSEDEVGNVYIADEFNSAIRRVSDGVISTFAGGKFGNSLDGSRMNLPQSMVAHASFLYVADTGNSAVRAFPLFKAGL